MSGLEFIEAMKKQGCKGIAQNMVVMSGALAQEDISKATALGCVVVEKPITLNQIDELIEEMKKVINPERRLADLV